MQAHRFHMRAVTMLMAIGLAGCATSGPVVEAPTVHLKGVEASDLSFKSQNFLLNFDVSNPNPFALRITSVRYRVQLEKQRFASGEIDCDVSIPASGNSSFVISVELDILKSAPRLTAVLRSGLRKPVRYDLHGRLTIDMPLAKPLSFSHSGVITIAAN